MQKFFPMQAHSILKEKMLIDCLAVKDFCFMGVIYGKLSEIQQTS